MLLYFFLLQLKTKLSGWYAGFNCTDEQLTEVADKISIFLAVDKSWRRAFNLLAATEGRTDGFFSVDYQCNYWNRRILGNCSAYSSPGADSEAFRFVQRNILEHVTGIDAYSDCENPTLCAL